MRLQIVGSDWNKTFTCFAIASHVDTTCSHNIRIDMYMDSVYTEIYTYVYVNTYECFSCFFLIHIYALSHCTHRFVFIHICKYTFRIVQI